MANAAKIIPVKLCYSHIGGQIGSLLAEYIIAKKWIDKIEGNDRLYFVTPKGKKAFKQLGIDLSLIEEQTVENS